jgi:phosphoserine aminotransferase
VTDRIFNFSAGPAILPESVLLRAQDALWSLGDSGIGILEHSHRGRQFVEVIERAEALCRELAGIPDHYRVLFLQGGASSQFFMVPMNLLGSEETADYIDTGVWSQKAIAEAERFGEVGLAYSGKADGYVHVPRTDEVQLSSSESASALAPVYVHYTSNNTIYGTQFRAEPAVPADIPLVCDASSDIFSRPIDMSKHHLVYAGAQKNLGPAGLTLVIIDSALVDVGARDLPAMLQYRTHADKDSCYNTPPTFAIYVLAEVLAWIRDLGGLAAMAEYNRAKAQVIYDFLDQSALFQASAAEDSRSHMNVCFRCTRPELEPVFVSQAEQRGMSGLAGHRSAGGMRASIYNAFPRAGCDALVAFMKEFEREHA